jgi:N-acetyl-gamma-glutamyl-phosphate reductase
MIRVAVVGATGYTGEELVRILSRHPEVEITSLTAIVEKPTKFSDLFPSFKGTVDLICKELNVDEASTVSDVVLLALPHRVSMEIAPLFLKKGKKVIDLSADYRLKDTRSYQQWYGAAHKDLDNLKSAVYGLPEFYRENIKGAPLIANPGCYPTAALLATMPLLKQKAKEIEHIIIDAKSGVTGAGRKPDLSLSFGEVDGNMKAYKINAHQHAPEINQELSRVAGKSVEAVFVPHVVPLQRGILATVYIQLRKGISEKAIRELYETSYQHEPFVRVLERGSFPQVKDVANTNCCDIGLKVEEDKGLLIAVSAIDNLGKGASGQAIQNMNIMYGFKETAGLA